MRGDFLNKKLIWILEEIIEYRNDFICDFLNNQESKDNINLEINIVGKKLFIKIIKNLKSIEPITDYEIMRTLKYPEGQILVLGDEYINYILEISEHMLKNEWYEVINSFYNLHINFNILQEKIYYKIINLINE